MLRAIIRRRLDREEKNLGQSLDYLRYMVRVSLRAFFKFVKIMPMATYQRVLPVEAYYVARLVATRHEDCGPCVQIEVNLAKRDNVDTEIIRYVLAKDVNSLPPNLSDVYRFTESVVVDKGDNEALREKLRQHFGEEGLVELAMAISSCRVFPTMKRALGYAKSCSLVRIEVEPMGVK